ncbi:hypothetical protein [Soonwooa sp.]|uniref:hypothetical protein n=1 Tax=Soonwooa sp. TaxID=1938592 RepID=UPI00262EA2E0|nr:hypothetical protein [Soonwooa sp.]
MKKEFIFEKVVKLPFYMFPLLVAMAAIPVFAIYIFFVARYVGTTGIMFVFLLIFGIVLLVLKSKMSDVKITLDDRYFTIDNDMYPKEDLVGVYAKDYTSKMTSIISMQFMFRDGSNIEITDTNYLTNVDNEKAEFLSNFIKTLQTEMGFTNVQDNSLRSMMGRGNLFYSK